MGRELGESARTRNLALGTFAAAEIKRSQTHCKWGHEFTPDNTLRRKNGGRSCRECNRIKNRVDYLREHMSEAEYVRVEDFAPILRQWKEQWDIERPLTKSPGTGNKGVSTQFEFESPIPWLAEKTGLTEQFIHKVIKQQKKHVTLTTADRILTALDQSWRLSQLEVIPNPRWSAERWADYMRERGCYD